MAAAATAAAAAAAAGAAAADDEGGLDARTISFKALQRCRTTIEDFASTYFPLHRLELPKDLFRFLDVLLYVEATIYQMDEDNEALSGRGALLPGHRFPAAAPLEGVLRSQGLWDERIEAELASGYRYWEMERRICATMEAHDLAAAWRGAQAAAAAAAAAAAPTAPGAAAAAPGAAAGQLSAAPPLPSPPPPDALSAGSSAPEAALSPGFSAPEALLTHESKSFDYRLLHLLLHRLVAGAGEPKGRAGPVAGGFKTAYDVPLLAFMAADERLVDIGDDLTDYEDDVVANSFNVYRAYLHLYGPDAPLLLARRIGELEAERARLLALLPRWQRELVEARQAAANEGQGSDKWIFPGPILRERAFRERERDREAAAAVGGG